MLQPIKKQKHVATVHDARLHFIQRAVICSFLHKLHINMDFAHDSLRLSSGGSKLRYVCFYLFLFDIVNYFMANRLTWCRLHVVEQVYLL